MALPPLHLQPSAEGAQGVRNKQRPSCVVFEWAGQGNGWACTPSLPKRRLMVFWVASKTTARGFEPLRAEPNGFRVHLLNRSDTLSHVHSKLKFVVGKKHAAPQGSLVRRCNLRLAQRPVWGCDFRLASCIFHCSTTRQLSLSLQSQPGFL